MYIKKKTLSSILCSMLYAEALCFVDYALSDKTHLVSKTLVMQMPPCRVDATSSLRHHLVLYGRNFLQSRHIVNKKPICCRQTQMYHVDYTLSCTSRLFMQTPYFHEVAILSQRSLRRILAPLCHVDFTLSFRRHLVILTPHCHLPFIRLLIII